MADGPSRVLYTGEQVLDLLNSGSSYNEEYIDDGLDDVFFPGSDLELGFLEEEVEDEERFVTL